MPRILVVAPNWIGLGAFALLGAINPGFWVLGAGLELGYLMPPIPGLVAWLTLGEAFTWLKAAGAAVTMAGVAYAQFGAGAPRKEAAQPDAA